MGTRIKGLEADGGWVKVILVKPVLLTLLT